MRILVVVVVEFCVTATRSMDWGERSEWVVMLVVFGILARLYQNINAPLG